MTKKRSRNQEPAPEAAAATRTAPSLSPQLGFVVQFRSGAGVDADVFSGRVEHLVSGRMARFESVLQLVDCLIRLLAEAQAA